MCCRLLELAGRKARAVAEAISREAFHNVSFFAGTYGELKAVLR
jgi:hypothetical protein